MKLRSCLAIGTAGLVLLLAGCASTTNGLAVPAGGVAAAGGTSSQSTSQGAQDTDSSSSDDPSTDSSDDSDTGDNSTSESSSSDSTSSDSTSSDSSDDSSSSSADDSVDTAAPPTVPGLNALCLPIAGAALDITQGKAGLQKVKDELAQAGTLPANVAADFKVLEEALGSASTDDDIYTILGSNPDANKAYQDIANWLKANCGG